MEHEYDILLFSLGTDFDEVEIAHSSGYPVLPDTYGVKLLV